MGLGVARLLQLGQMGFKGREVVIQGLFLGEVGGLRKCGVSLWCARGSLWLTGHLETETPSPRAPQGMGRDTYE